MPHLGQKSGLTWGSTFEFRLRGRDQVDWFPWGAVTRHATLEAGAKRLPPCALRAFDAESLTVEWEAPPCKPQAGEPPSAYLYELQVRDSTCDAGWTTVSTSLKGTVAKKKNLSQAGRYSFRVRPSLQDESQPGEQWSFSAPNATDFRPRSPVAPIFNDLFGPKLVDAKGMAEGMAEGGSYPVDSKLAGCVVALYFSARSDLKACFRKKARNWLWYV